MTQNKQLVFIIGAPRSGTTWLQALLAAHPAVCTSAELMLYNHYIAPWVAAWDEQIKLHKEGSLVGLPTLWSEDEFYNFLKEFLNQVYSRVLSVKPQATIILDKHPGYAYHLDLINKLAPNAKFFNIIRDGRDTAVSMLAASQGWGWSWAPKRIDKAAASWRNHVLAAQQAKQYEGQYFEVLYEDLLEAGEKILSSIFEFIGLSVDSTYIHKTLQEHQFEKMKKKSTGATQLALPEGFFRQGRRGDWRTKLTPTQRYLFHETAGDLLCKLGYADEFWWAENESQRLMLPILSSLMSRDRSRRKLVGGVKKILGPGWTERIRFARGRFQHGAGKEVPENG